ncbi:DUF4974 domain-containing protein [Puteibacter caeruleilacunae]|nr:DUF4974 domain-containing protein [Puteibacter caeruleilacunae]
MNDHQRHITNITKGKYSLADHNEVERIFSEKKMNDVTQDFMKSHWNEFTEEKSDRSLEHVFKRLVRDINATKENKTRKLRTTWIRTIAAAASIILIIGAYYLGKEMEESQLVSSIVIENTDGLRSRFTLPDGTSGWLGNNSVLKYTDGFSRKVDLDGQAYFDVTHDEEKTFVVSSAVGPEVIVHGTNFNVNSYAKEGSFEVVLEDGSISIKNKGKDVVKMVPGELAEYDVTTSKFKLSMVDVEDYLGWKEGKLILKDRTLEESCALIGHYYNIDIIANIPQLKSENVRLILDDESLEETLKILEVLFPINYRIEDPQKLDNGRFSKQKVIIKQK